MLNSGLTALPVLPTLKFVGRNQVNMTQKAFQARRQFFGMLRLIIDPAKQGIFEGNPSSCPFRMTPASCKQLIEVILAGNGHQLTANLVVWCMQGNGKRNRQTFISEFYHLRNQTAS